MEIKPVAHIENDFKSKFAVPRQSGLSKIKSKIVFEKEYSDENAIRELDGFSHIWLIWGFSENESEAVSLTVRPPRLGGNKRVGVFASRSPFRPNGLGLSSVKLEKIEFDEKRKPALIVSGADLISGTPIYDIKPYIKFSDSHSDAVSGYCESNEFPELEVVLNEELLSIIPDDKQGVLMGILKNDPRPAYHHDEREYGFFFADYEIKFKVEENKLRIIKINNGSFN